MQLYSVRQHLSSLRAFGQHKVQEEDVSRSRRKHGQGDSSFPCSDSMVSYVSYLLSDLNVNVGSISISSQISSKNQICHFLFFVISRVASHALTSDFPCKISSQGTRHHSACQSWPCGKHPSNPGLPTWVVRWISGWGNMFRNMKTEHWLAMFADFVYQIWQILYENKRWL